MTVAVTVMRWEWSVRGVTSPCSILDFDIVIHSGPASRGVVSALPLQHRVPCAVPYACMLGTPCLSVLYLPPASTASAEFRPRIRSCMGEYQACIQQVRARARAPGRERGRREGGREGVEYPMLGTAHHLHACLLLTMHAWYFPMHAPARSPQLPS